MELLLSSLESIKIAMMKYIALLISNILAFSISIPLIGLFCALYLEQIVSISIVSILLLIQISGLALLTSSIEGYFRTNTEIISLVILPLIIPGIVLSGLSLNQSSNEGFIWVLLGMDMIITPITIVLSSYLIRNIYNR
jgi:heme exporter protein B